MLKILLAIVVGLVGAVLLHLIIILSLPHFTGLDAYTRILARGDLNRFHLLAAQPDKAGLSVVDPFMHVAVCSFDVETIPLRLQARGSVPFWSLAIFDSASNEIFSMNDRTSVGGGLDVVIASPIQLTALRKALPEQLAQSILVEMPRPDGYAVVRTLAPRRSFDQAAQAFLQEASCQDFTVR